MKANKLIFMLLIPVILSVLVIGFFFIIFSPTTIETKFNPAGTHKGKLIRHNGIDVNFKVTIDGEQVYWSPDFAPVEEDFREHLVWDKTGNILVLEVAGTRLFGYNAESKSVLTDDELMSVIYIPFSHYGFEGKLPQTSK